MKKYRIKLMKKMNKIKITNNKIAGYNVITVGENLIKI